MENIESPVNLLKPAVFVEADEAPLRNVDTATLEDFNADRLFALNEGHLPKREWDALYAWHKVCVLEVSLRRVINAHYVAGGNPFTYLRQLSEGL